MDSIIESFEVDGLTVNIRYDHTPQDPRKMCENLGTFYGEHRRYSSPDKMDAESIPHQIARDLGRTRVTSTCWPWNNSELIGLPVWLYDHSGTCYRAAEKNPFACPWDSGLFGVVYVTKEKARAEFGRLTAGTVAKVKECLQQEVRTYSAWANGESYGWEVVDSDGNQIDSCWGYIGDIEGAKRDAMESATYAATVAA